MVSILTSDFRQEVQDRYGGSSIVHPATGIHNVYLPEGSSSHVAVYASSEDLAGFVRPLGASEYLVAGVYEIRLVEESRDFAPDFALMQGTPLDRGNYAETLWAQHNLKLYHESEFQDVKILNNAPGINFARGVRVTIEDDYNLGSSAITGTIVADVRYWIYDRNDQNGYDNPDYIVDSGVIYDGLILPVRLNILDNDLWGKWRLEEAKEARQTEFEVMSALQEATLDTLEAISAALQDARAGVLDAAFEFGMDAIGAAISAATLSKSVAAHIYKLEAAGATTDAASFLASDTPQEAVENLAALELTKLELAAENAGSVNTKAFFRALGGLAVVSDFVAAYGSLKELNDTVGLVDALEADFDSTYQAWFDLADETGNMFSAMSQFSIYYHDGFKNYAHYPSMHDSGEPIFYRDFQLEGIGYRGDMNLPNPDPSPTPPTTEEPKSEMPVGSETVSETPDTSTPILDQPPVNMNPTGGVTISGSGKVDAISGLAGNDLIKGLGGNDRLSGGGGNDRLFGNSGNDKLFGNGGKDELKGGAGKDSLKGGSGNDKLFGNGGKDGLKGGSGKDALNGGGGKDSLKGGSGNDKLKGGGGADRVDGGGGNDVLTGNGGKDEFVFKLGHDTITDYKSQDTIDLQGAAGRANLVFIAEVVNEDLVLSFSNKNSLTIEGITKIDDLNIV